MPLDAVTGAFSYTGKYIARRLLAEGRDVCTLTGHPGRDDPFDGCVEVRPYAFDDPAGLARSLDGVDTFYVTYWVRFPLGRVTFEGAVRNTLALFDAARRAGVRRVVYVSITNADEASPLPYFRSKGHIERALRDSGLSHAIVRPTLVFGLEDILVNNVAWLLRRYPLCMVPGDGAYPVQPVYADDLAAIAIASAHQAGNPTLDAAGPERYGFLDMVRLMATEVGSHARVITAPPAVALWAARVAGIPLRDRLLTRDEVKGLMAGLLVAEGEPAGRTRFSEWLHEHRREIGSGYHSEVGRHYR
ncbi:MAG: NAD(P)H-binding protein [Chloroflexi bacterium]|nr:NAD(P)H-binding protein [Chloroflexota bacterium]